MKTSFKTRIAAVILVTAFGMVSYTASAQHHDNRNKKNNKEYKYEKQHKADYRSYHADRDGRSGYGDRGHSYDYDRNDRRHSNYGYRSDVRYNDSRYVYHHPRYGNVYRKFHSAPVRLHCNNGDFYYHGNHYYRYYPRVGYVRVEVPANYVFVDLPVNYSRVYVDGGWYYRSGDLYFERCANGYRLSPHFNVSFSAHF